MQMIFPTNPLIFKQIQIEWRNKSSHDKINE